MAVAIKPFFNDHTRTMLNPGDLVRGFSEIELRGLERSHLIRRDGPTVTVAEPASPGDPVVMADAGGEITAPAASTGATGRARRTLGSIVGGGQPT